MEGEGREGEGTRESAWATGRSGDLPPGTPPSFPPVPAQCLSLNQARMRPGYTSSGASRELETTSVPWLLHEGNCPALEDAWAPPPASTSSQQPLLNTVGSGLSSMAREHRLSAILGLSTCACFVPPHFLSLFLDVQCLHEFSTTPHPNATYRASSLVYTAQHPHFICAGSWGLFLCLVSAGLFPPSSTSLLRVPHTGWPPLPASSPERALESASAQEWDIRSQWLGRVPRDML